MKYWNIDIRNVTITCYEQHKTYVMRYLLRVKEENFYEGWISEINPSCNFVGFAITANSDEYQFIPDFHNLPFYYKKDYDSYMKLIIKHLRKDVLFYNWKGQYSPIRWEYLLHFVNRLGTVRL